MVGAAVFLFMRLIKKLGLPPVRLHDLRHCAATLSLAAGLHMKAIQTLLGHSSYSLTADIAALALLGITVTEGVASHSTAAVGLPWAETDLTMGTVHISEQLVASSYEAMSTTAPR